MIAGTFTNDNNSKCIWIQRIKAMTGSKTYKDKWFFIIKNASKNNNLHSYEQKVTDSI